MLSYKQTLTIMELIFLITFMLVAPRASAQTIYSGAAFQEVGLPAGTLWTVICNGTQYNSMTNEITIKLAPGMYNFSIASVSGYAASPQSGEVKAYLDPIKLTTITFSATVPEFSVKTWVLVSVFLIVTVSTAILRKLRSGHRGYAVEMHEMRQASVILSFEFD